MGGRTIAEAKERISYAEFIQWARYRLKRGSLNWGMRVEHGTAQLAALFANVNSRNGGYKVSDFAPFHDQPAIGLDQAMKEWV